MTPDPASLDLMHDIVMPPPASWWPPAPGWLWLSGVACALVLVAVVRGFIRWQRNRYRREALAELARLESAAADAAQQGRALAGLAELLKRTALTAYSREEVAALTGVAWFAFLDRTGGTHFGNGLGPALERSIYQPPTAPWDAAALRELAGETRAWIRRHAPLPDPGSSATVSEGAPSPGRTGRRRAA